MRFYCFLQQQKFQQRLHFLNNIRFKRQKDILLKNSSACITLYASVLHHWTHSCKETEHEDITESTLKLF